MNSGLIPYQNKHQNQIVVICASGETLLNYKQIPNAIHICVNQAATKIQPDYFFCQDYSGKTSKYIESIHSNIQTFFGSFHPVKTSWSIPETLFLKCNASKYIVSAGYGNLEKDISKKPIFDFNSIVFPAIQFALFTNPSKIILVGCDCTKVRFDKSRSGIHTKNIIETWKRIKIFASKNYPETKIYSIRPIGLKNIFPELS